MAGAPIGRLTTSKEARTTVTHLCVFTSVTAFLVPLYHYWLFVNINSNQYSNSQLPVFAPFFNCLDTPTRVPTRLRHSGRCGGHARVPFYPSSASLSLALALAPGCPFDSSATTSISLPSQLPPELTGLSYIPLGTKGRSKEAEELP